MPDVMHERDDAEVTLSGAIAAAVDGARDHGRPMAVAYVDRDGQPQLSLRGTVHVHADDELAFWARSPRLPIALISHPRVALLYHDLPARTFYTFTGRARVVIEDGPRDDIFEATPEAEQARDPDRHGAAIVVAVDAVDGAGPAGSVRMRRVPVAVNGEA